MSEIYFLLSATLKIQLKNDKIFAKQSGNISPNVSYADNGSSLTISNISLNITMINVWDNSLSSQIVEDIVKQFTNKNFKPNEKIEITNNVKQILGSEQKSNTQIPIQEAYLIVSGSKEKDGTISPTIEIQVGEDYLLQDTSSIELEETSPTTTVKSNKVTISNFVLIGAQLTSETVTKFVGQDINASTIKDIANKLKDQKFITNSNVKEPVIVEKSQISNNEELKQLFNFVTTSLFGEWNSDAQSRDDTLANTPIKSLAFKKTSNQAKSNVNVDLSITLDETFAFRNNGTINLNTLSDSSLSAKYGSNSQTLEINSIPLSDVTIVQIVDIDENEVIQSINNGLNGLGKVFVDAKKQQLDQKVINNIKDSISSSIGEGLELGTDYTLEIQVQPNPSKGNDVGSQVLISVTGELIGGSKENTEFNYPNNLKNRDASFTRTDKKEFVISNISSENIVYGNNVDSSSFANSITTWANQSLNIDSSLIKNNNEFTISSKQKDSSLNIISDVEELGAKLNIENLPDGTKVKFDLSPNGEKAKITNLVITLPDNYYFNNEGTDIEEYLSVDPAVKQSTYTISQEIATNWTIENSIDDGNINTTLSDNIKEVQNQFTQAGEKVYQESPASVRDQASGTFDEIKGTILKGFNFIENLSKVTVKVEEVTDDSEGGLTKESSPKKYKVTVTLELKDGYYFKNKKSKTFESNPIEITVNEDDSASGGSGAGDDSGEAEKDETQVSFFSQFKPF